MPTKKRQPVPALTKLTKGTLVRVAGENGFFHVGNIAKWGGHDYATVTHYHLTQIGGGRLDQVDAKLITRASEEDRVQASLEEAARHKASQALARKRAAIERMKAAQAREEEALAREKEEKARQDALRARMLADPAKTLRMAQGLFRSKNLQCRDLELLIPRLIPRYRKTHCWSCFNQDLNSLDNPICPACGALKCRCGVCLCDRFNPPTLKPRISRNASRSHAR